jgi:hypothetical protein
VYLSPTRGTVPHTVFAPPHFPRVFTMVGCSPGVIRATISSLGLVAFWWFPFPPPLVLHLGRYLNFMTLSNSLTRYLLILEFEFLFFFSDYYLPQLGCGMIVTVWIPPLLNEVIALSLGLSLVSRLSGLQPAPSCCTL